MQAFHEVFPHLKMAANVPKLVKTDDVDWDGVDAAFCCLPHATTQARMTQPCTVTYLHMCFGTTPSSMILLLVID